MYTTAQYNLRRAAVVERSREEVEGCAEFGNFRSNAAALDLKSPSTKVSLSDLSLCPASVFSA